MPDVEDGLPDNSIVFVTDDSRGNLWCGSGSGVFRVSKTDLSRQVVWDSLTGTGWEPVTQVAVDETWSALRIRPTEKVGTRRR